MIQVPYLAFISSPQALVRNAFFPLPAFTPSTRLSPARLKIVTPSCAPTQVLPFPVHREPLRPQPRPNQQTPQPHAETLIFFPGFATPRGDTWFPQIRDISRLHSFFFFLRPGTRCDRSSQSFPPHIFQCGLFFIDGLLPQKKSRMAPLVLECPDCVRFRFLANRPCFFFHGRSWPPPPPPSHWALEIFCERRSLAFFPLRLWMLLPSLCSLRLVIGCEFDRAIPWFPLVSSVRSFFPGPRPPVPPPVFPHRISVAERPYVPGRLAAPPITVPRHGPGLLSAVAPSHSLTVLRPFPSALSVTPSLSRMTHVGGSPASLVALRSPRLHPESRAGAQFDHPETCFSPSEVLRDTTSSPLLLRICPLQRGPPFKQHTLHSFQPLESSVSLMDLSSLPPPLAKFRLLPPVFVDRVPPKSVFLF